MIKYSFEQAYYQLPVEKRKQVKKEIMEAIGIKSRPSWISRLRGDIEPKISEAQKIEEIFKKNGINIVWT